tara:strand:- start:6280 stop:6939 length:660 start_codon:yes stop_codon:yes gene_type:complete
MQKSLKPTTAVAQSLPKPKAVLFDLDGTLVESTLDFNFLKQNFDIQPGQDVLQFISNLPSDEKHRANELIETHELEDAQRAKTLPGALDLLLALNRAGIPTAIITRNSRKAAKIKIENNSLPIEFLISREDAKPKPNPEALLALAESWQVEPKDCWYIGDYLYDLQAANNAGMVAGLYTGSHLEESRYSAFMHLADIVFNDHDQLRDAWEEMDYLCIKN